jgi:hypothetical protein
MENNVTAPTLDSVLVSPRMIVRGSCEIMR